MASARKRDSGPRIVAELGRPETPEETAARKAENSRKHRANQTLINLVVALIASLGIVLFLVVVVVRDPAPRAMVDYVTVAEQSQQLSEEPLSVPALPPEWTANNAELRRPANDVTSWYIGFVTPSEQFIALTQGFDTNPTWLSNVLNSARETGTEIIDGNEWTLYDRRGSDSPGNLAYAMVTSSGDTTWVLYGTAGDVEFRTLATSLSTEIAASEIAADSDAQPEENE